MSYVAASQSFPTSATSSGRHGQAADRLRPCHRARQEELGQVPIFVATIGISASRAEQHVPWPSALGASGKQETEPSWAAGELGQATRGLRSRSIVRHDSGPRLPGGDGEGHWLASNSAISSRVRRSTTFFSLPIPTSVLTLPVGRWMTRTNVQLLPSFSARPICVRKSSSLMSIHRFYRRLTMSAGGIAGGACLRLSSATPEVKAPVAGRSTSRWGFVRVLSELSMRAAGRSTARTSLPRTSRPRRA